jgi:hypothetical protein
MEQSSQVSMNRSLASLACLYDCDLAQLGQSLSPGNASNMAM